MEKFGTDITVFAYGKRWEGPESMFPVFKFRSSNPEEFEDHYARLTELLQSETHPYRPEFHPALISGNGIRRALKSFPSK